MSGDLTRIGCHSFFPSLPPSLPPSLSALDFFFVFERMTACSPRGGRRGREGGREGGSAITCTRRSLPEGEGKERVHL